MPAAGGKKKFKFKFEIDLMGTKPKEVKVDFDKARGYIESNKDAKKYMKPLKFEVDAELDETEFDEKTIIEDGYYAFRGCVVDFDSCVLDAQKKNKPEEVKKGLDKLQALATKWFQKWLKDKESGKADNDKALKEGSKALAGMESIDPSEISEGPRLDAIAALEPLLAADADEKAKEKATGELRDAYDKFKKNGGEANKAIKALMDTSKKIAANTKADASLKAFGAKITKEKTAFKSLSAELDALTKMLEEAAELAGSGKLDQKAAKTYTDMLKKMKSLDSTVAKSFTKLENYGKEFAKLEDKLSK
jgi:hypothetical protein